MIPHPAHILLVDDELSILNAYTRALGRSGYRVTCADSLRAATALLASEPFDVVVADVDMPDGSGVTLLRDTRASGSDIPFVMMTGGSNFADAVAAVENGALRFLLKPVEMPTLYRAVDEAVQLGSAALERKRALEVLRLEEERQRELAGRQARFTSAVQDIWIAHQPIVRWSEQRVHAYESLVRGVAPGLSRPDQIFQTADELGRLLELGRAIRANIAKRMEALPAGVVEFVNLHAADLSDDELFDPGAPLTPHAGRIVLEITERARLEEIHDLGARIQRLRALGYGIALDDLGAGYSGLSALAQIRPDVVKLDMSLVRGIEADTTRQRVVASLIALTASLEMEVVAEGVETARERDTLSELGCDTMQGYLFAAPGRGLPEVSWA